MEGDKIVLYLIDANSKNLNADDQFAALLQGGAFTMSSFTSNACLYFDQTNQILCGNTDGVNATAEFAIEIHMVGVSLNSSDIVF